MHLLQHRQGDKHPAILLMDIEHTNHTSLRVSLRPLGIQSVPISGLVYYLDNEVVIEIAHSITEAATAQHIEASSTQLLGLHVRICYIALDILSGSDRLKYPFNRQTGADI